MNNENQQKLSREDAHVRTPEEVRLMNEDAERAARIRKMTERLGALPVEQVVSRPQVASGRNASDRLGG